MRTPRSALERNNSQPSPSHDLPTYTQATRNASDPNIIPIERQRSFSDPEEQLRTALSSAERFKPQLETIESVPGVGDNPAPGVVGTEVAVDHRESHDQPANQIEEHPNESTDFAHNLRCGTSTPIDDSPLLTGEQSRTFDTDYGGQGTINTLEVDLSGND